MVFTMDKIAIALTKDASMRIYAAVTTNTVAEAARLHKTSAVAAAALGRTLTAAAMMGAMLKNDNGSLTMQIKGDGPLGMVVAVAEADGTVRGYASNPQAQFPPRANGKLNVAGAVGKNGFINILRDNAGSDFFKGPYSGTVPLVSGEIAEDLTAYYAISEQIPTSVGLGVSVGADSAVLASGGFIAQVMPGFGYDDEKNISAVESALKEIPSISELISGGCCAEKLAETVLGGIEHNILETRPVHYRCNCNIDRVERALLSIGKADLQELIDSGEDSHVNCHFCDKEYTVTAKRLAGLR